MEKNDRQDRGPTQMPFDNESLESIAVIGGGPGAMFLCHAMEVQRNELLKKGEDVSRFPIVKCFERAPGPGGVWRSDRSHEDEDDTQKGESKACVDANIATTSSIKLDSSFSEEKKEDDRMQETSASPDGRETKKMKIEGAAQASSLNASTFDPADKTPNMYSALWTNGMKEAFEFPDYTFQQHFGDVRMPTYLPRKYVFDYIVARCTNNCPNFFDKYFCFRTSVVNVKYLEDEKDESSCAHSMNKKFRVHTRNETTGIDEIKIFDKCIWAGGMNGIPNIPSKLVNVFKDGGFKGSLVHSSDTTNFKSDVENKRLLIVGGGYSAEDLALMAIKEGVSQIYCTFRGDTEKAMCWTSRWPYDKVKILPETTIAKVEGNNVTLDKVFMDYCEGEYKLEEDEEGEKTTLKEIDTVIFCTGYLPNFNMLDPLLRDAFDGDDDSGHGIRLPEDWKMNENAAVDSILGKDHKHVKPSKLVYPCDDFANAWYDLYRGSILIENPNMMYFLNDFSDTPLMEADITAWMLARFVTGQNVLPSAEAMEAENYQITLDCMQNIDLRFKMDHKFNKKIEKVIGDGMSKEQEALWEADEEEAEDYQYRLLGKIMNDTEYPVRYLCKDGKSFTELGTKVKDLDAMCGRRKMHEYKYDDCERNITDGDEQKQHLLRPGWMTFRDIPDAEIFSFYTGIKACPLPQPWFELDENDKLW